MSEQLSGRNLEVAVAKALGYAVYENTDFAPQRQWGLRGPLGYAGVTTDMQARVYEDCAKKYLTDPVAFDTVLAAAEASDRCTYYDISVSVKGKFAKASIAPMLNFQEFRGATRQEAFLRAFVAWKGAA